jgi:hypothetical protein
VDCCEILKVPSDADTEECTKPHRIFSSIASIFAMLFMSYQGFTAYKLVNFFFPGSKMWSLTVCAFEYTCAQGPCNVLTIE